MRLSKIGKAFRFVFPSMIVTAVSLAQTTPAHAGKIIAGGTGMSLTLMSEAGKTLNSENPEISLKVLPSMGSGGGIKALLDGVLDVSLSARPLKEKEAESLQEVFCFVTALVLATNPSHVSNINLSELAKLYSDPSPTWPNGTPLKVVLRPSSGSEIPYLTKKVPGFEAAIATARKRPGVPVGITDHMNLDIAEQMDGVLAITTLLQIRSEKKELSPVSLDGIEASVETLRSGRYPFPIKVCVIAKKGKLSVDIEILLGHLKHPTTASLLESYGAVPVEP